MNWQFKWIAKGDRKCDECADGEITVQVEAFKYCKSNFNTNKTLTEFHLFSNDSNQNLRHQLLFHVCESSCMEMFSLLCLGVGESRALVSSLVCTAVLQVRNIGAIARGKSRLIGYSVDKTLDSQPSGKSASERWGQSRSWLGTKVSLSLETACTASEAANYCSVSNNDDGLNKDFFYVLLEL